MTTTTVTTKTIIVTRDLDNATPDDITIASSWQEAENMQRGQGDDCFSVDASDATRSTLLLAREYLRDVIARQSRPHASMVVEFADEHLARIEAILS